MNTRTCNEIVISLHRARMQMDTNDHSGRLRIQRIMHYIGQQLGRAA